LTQSPSSPAAAYARRVFPLPTTFFIFFSIFLFPPLLLFFSHNIKTTDSNHRWLRTFTASTALAIPMRASRTNTASKTIITRAFSGFHDAVMT